MKLYEYLTEEPCQPEDVPDKYLKPVNLATRWYEEALAKIPAPGQGWNPSLMPAARAGKRAGIKLNQFIADVKACSPNVPEGRLKEINRAYERCNLETTPEKRLEDSKVITKPKPVMLPDPIENETEKFLKALFEPNETIVIAPSKYNSLRNREEPIDLERQAKTRDEWIAAFAITPPSTYFKNTTGIYIKINPLTPGNKEGSAMPLASDSDVTAYRWLLVESDANTKEEQLGAFHAAGIPYATVVDSGKKSLHALVRLDADSLEDFKKQASEVYENMGKLLVMDMGNSHPSRYSRLPGCQRGASWQSLIECWDDVPSYHQHQQEKWLAGAHSLSEYFYMDMPEEQTLLGNRYLCREGSMLFVGPSGIGKSSASVQCDILWALGESAFGIKPAFPLKILCVQAENDDGDMIEITRGVMQGLRLSYDQIEAVGKNTLYRNYKESTGQAFLLWLEKLINAYKPDLVRLDPLQAYLGDDAKEVKAVADFCRTTLNPILTKHQCACIIAHHTPKTNNQNTKEWRPSDWMYAGAGSADLTNWARCVMVIDPVGESQDTFRFVAAKRWKRIGWKDTLGNPTHERFFKHAAIGSIYWLDAEAPSKSEQGKKADINDLYNLVPTSGTIPKNILVSRAQKLGIGINKSRDWTNDLVFEKRLYEACYKRKGARDEILISRNTIPKQSILAQF